MSDPTSKTLNVSAIEELKKYTACDISDALLALENYPSGQRRTAGFLSDLVNLSASTASTSTNQRESTGMLIYPAYTVQFRSTSASTTTTSSSSEALKASAPQVTESNIPQGSQWSDLAEQDCVVIVHQPPDQKCAVVGGIHMLRLWKRGVKGLIVDGRVRDISSLQGLDMPVWAKGTSTVGAGAEGKPHAVQVPLVVSEVEIQPGDLVCIDGRENGVVRIPKTLVDDVVSWLNERGDSENRILEMVRDGATVADAFKRFR